MATIAIVGAGHVGVVYAAGLAELGHRVHVVDVDRRRVAGLHKGRVWFYEPGLPELLARGLSRRRISFTTSYREGLRGARFVFICVPTPATSDGSLDDRYLRSALTSVRANVRRPYPIVVNKSTVPVGTGDAVREVFGKTEIPVVSNPEFLAEGRAVEDFFHPTRVVIGSHDKGAAEAVAALFAPLRAPVVQTDPVTAELSKLAANAFLATKISFANALSRIGEAVGADGDDLVKALSLDPRIGPGHLRAGLGFGGSCLPKDLAAVEQLARRYAGPAVLFGAVAQVNREQRHRIIDFLVTKLGSLIDRRIAVLGASFKANTDDLRESPALLLAQQLREMHAKVVVYDPAAAAQLRGNGLLAAPDALTAARRADAVVVATEWPEFAAIDLRSLRKAMRGNLLVDGKGLIDGAAARRAGFEVFSFTARNGG